MFQPSLVAGDNASNSSLNTYKPPLFTSSCNSISEESGKVNDAAIKKSYSRRCSTRRTQIGGRAGSVVSQNSLDRRNSLINESKKKEDIASILERQQSIRSGSDRKSSLASLGQRFSSIVSISSQVAATMAAMSVSEILTNPLPTIEVEPNDLVDKLVPEIMFAASDSKLFTLPIMKVSGIVLSDGNLTGMSNMSRWGNANMDIKHDRVVLSFTVAVIDLLATYSWKRKKIKGLIKAGVCRTLLHIKIRQKIKTTGTGTQPQPELLEASLGSLETIHLTLCGLGPINFLVRRLVKDHVVHNIRGMFESQAKIIIKTALDNFSIFDHLPPTVFNKAGAAI